MTTVTNLTLDHLQLVRLHHAQNAATVATIATIGTTQATAPNGAHLVDRLRFILSIAQSAAPELWIQETADTIVDAVLSLQAFERDHVDPRRRVSLARAARMANTVRSMRQAGHTRADAVAALCERECLSRGHVYALLRMNVCGDITVQKAG